MEIGNPSMHFFLQPARYPSVRKYLDKICPLMEVKWEYDAESNAIRVDFGWRHSDARSSSELLAFLREHRPAPADSQIFKPHPTDPWDVAFNALLSKEENFPQVWELRARADAEVPFLVAMDTENLCVGILRDRQGRPHTLILNNQPMMVSPGAGSASYYLFDAQGRFEQGGIFNTGHRVLSVSAWLNQEGTRLTLEGWFNGSSSLTNTFELSDWGLVETSEFDASGVPLPAWEHSGYHLGDRIYTATAAPGGLTKEEVIQNAWSLFIRNTNNPVDRAEIVDHQLELSREQEDFLFTFWDDMGGKDFLPLVRRAAAVPEGNGKALAILEGIDPEAARPLILEDIGREKSLYIHERQDSGFALVPWLSMPRAPMPELDALFRARLKDPASDPSLLLPLIERYGTPGLLPDVIAFYRPRAGNWECEVENDVLKFWIRSDPQAGVDALVHTLHSRQETRCYAYLLEGVLTTQWTELAKPVVLQALEDADEDVVMGAIRLLLDKGGERDIPAIVAALSRIDGTYPEPNELPQDIRHRQHASLAKSLLAKADWAFNPEQKRQLERISQEGTNAVPTGYQVIPKP